MKTTVGVIFGGRSTEHEISVISANQAINAINTEKYEIVPLYISKQGIMYSGKSLLDLNEYKNIPELLKKCQKVYFKPEFENFNLYYDKKGLFGEKPVVLSSIDVVLPVLHGANGEDGSIQGLLQIIGFPYVGCNVMASANGMDKISMKMILENQGLPIIKYVWFTDKEWFTNKNEKIAEVEEKLGYPVIIKPSNLGSSVGIGRADNREELIEKVGEAEKYSDRIIVEHLVEQLKEINCSVLGDSGCQEASVLEEPIKTGDFLSYEDKYMGGGKGQKGMQASAKRIPAELSEEMTKQIQHIAKETFRVLGCQGVSRVDVIIDESDNKVYVNEINTIPGSLSFYLWEETGKSFTNLIDDLISLALKRNRDFSHKTLSFDQNIFAMNSFSGTKGSKGVKH